MKKKLIDAVLALTLLAVFLGGCSQKKTYYVPTKVVNTYAEKNLSMELKWDGNTMQLYTLSSEADGDPVPAWTVEFDDRGLVLERETFDKDGQLRKHKTYTYTFDEHGQITEIKTKSVLPTENRDVEYDSLFASENTYDV